MSDDVATYRQFVATFTDFLIVATHTILFERNIYPPESFISARKYNFAVHQNRHPKVCEWINDAVAQIETELVKGTVERVSIVIYDPTTNKALERFVFDLERFPVIPQQDLDTPLVRASGYEEPIAVLPLVDIQEQFRGVMSKLSNCRANLRSIPEGCAFTFAYDVRQGRDPPLSHPQAWIPVDPIASIEQDKAGVVPLRSVSGGEMAFEVWIEEALIEEPSEKSDSFGS